MMAVVVLFALQALMLVVAIVGAGLATLLTFDGFRRSERPQFILAALCAVIAIGSAVAVLLLDGASAAAVSTW